MLVAADGAESKIARSLGVVKTPPNTYCSRSFAKAGTHSFPKSADHVVFYPKKLLPGFFVVFHELEDFLSLCCYFIPCGGMWKGAKPRDLERTYNSIIKEDPYITQALGKDVEITPVHFASLRVGGVEKSYADRFVVIGDAAGQVDPLTGAGIHYGMSAAKMAADTIIEGFKAGDLSEARMKQYHDKWRKAFGRDFYLAFKIMHLLYKYPQILDSIADLILREGDDFIVSWALAMMGSKPKSWFLRLEVVAPIVFDALMKTWYPKRGKSKTKNERVSTHISD
eukprot:TRINITY_DN13045_c0_g1_i1.p1 TRINITY_DN13045_c0_g1~~TRINITY_DN13045_c0_g1_i1.p1  ORF type:complete len:282 (-),score=46.85 TRINITY_DN13045_c0_g1_i1:35-880(-)